MATYYIVDKDKDPLDSDEINAGETIEVQDGDVFIIESSADDDIKFESDGGSSTDFQIIINDSNSSGFDIEIDHNLNVDIQIGDDVDIGDVKIDAQDADSVTLTAGDNVTIDSYQGSKTGVDDLTFGDNFTTEKIETKGGDDSITIGDGGEVKEIKTEAGDDTITIGDDFTGEKIETKQGDDAVTIGDGGEVEEIKTESGDDTITIGDDFTGEKIETKQGDDAVTIGDGGQVEEIKTESGDDTVTIGNDFTGEKIETKQGDDAVIIGDGGAVEEIKTESGDDTITIGDDFTGEKIETKQGDDTVVIGDGGEVEEIKTESGDDIVSVGDDFSGDKIETKQGDDIVIVGEDASIGDLDGGSNTDTLISQTDLPDAENFENVVCFVRGTFIQTQNGEVPIEELTIGDMVKTLDRGFQPIRWIGSTKVDGHGKFAPVRIAPGVMGNRRDLWVSQQHRMLVDDWRSELYFGEGQVLIPAKSLVDDQGVRLEKVDDVEYFHMLFDNHEIVFAEGAASESFHPGKIGLGGMALKARAEIFALFPELEHDVDSWGPSARLSLKGYEGALLTRTERSALSCAV